MTHKEIYGKRAEAIRLIAESSSGLEVLIASRRFLSSEELSELNGQQTELETATDHAYKHLMNFKRILVAVPAVNQS